MQVDELVCVQLYFHALIRHVAEDSNNMIVATHPEGVALPTLDDLLQSGSKRKFLPIPGMYGGFGYTLKQMDGAVTLSVESFSRVVEGSWRRHAITRNGVKLVEYDSPGLEESDPDEDGNTCYRFTSSRVECDEAVDVSAKMLTAAKAEN